MMHWIEVWKSVLMHPKETFADEKKGSNIMEGAKQVALAYAVAGIIIGIVIAIFGAGPAAMFLGPMAAVAGVAAIVVTPVMLVIMGLITSFIGAGIIHVMSKLLGGTGTFAQQYYLMAIWMAPVMLLGMVLNLVPIVGQLIGLLLNLYGLYLGTLAIKEAQGLSTLKAVLAWLIPIIVLGILAMVVAAAMFAALLGGIAAGSGGA